MSFIKDQLKKLEGKIMSNIDERLDDPAVRKKVIDKWTESVNIPILNENTEEKIFAAIYDKAVEVIKSVLK